VIVGHQLTEKDQMFSAGNKVPWHGLGRVVENVNTIEEGMQLANLDWRVTLKPLVLQETQKLVTHRAVVREDTNDVLGIVGPNWQPLQNIDSFKFFNSFLESGVATLETAGSLRGGEIVWVLAKIKDSECEIVKGDPLERYVLLSNGHNGLLAVRVGFTTVRVVCANTLNASHNSEASKLIRIKHTGQLQNNLDNVKSVMNVAQSEFIADIEKMKVLVKKGINKDDIKKYVKLTFFSNKTFDTDRKENKFNQMVNTIESLMETGLGSDIKSVKGTMWGLYNASTEYLSHHACRSVENRMQSLWFGQNNKLNERLLQVALEMV
jgi:phage/plasmid-like protein (TIGR03299 family)